MKGEGCIWHIRILELKVTKSTLQDARDALDIVIKRILTWTGNTGTFLRKVIASVQLGGLRKDMRCLV